MKETKQREYRLLNPKTGRSFKIKAKSFKHAQNRASIEKNERKYQASEYLLLN